jgi:hypothetical protein
MATNLRAPASAGRLRNSRSPVGLRFTRLWRDCGKQRSTPSQPDDRLLEGAAIEPFDGIGLRGGKIELPRHHLGGGKKPVA